jgi:hypothetical protein
MKRFFAVAGLAVLGFAMLGVPAGAKGASEVTIKGGEGPPITFGTAGGSNGDPGSGSTLGRFTDASGIFPSIFDTYPDPMLDHAPTKDLGPRYTATWRFPARGGHSDFITQYIYPFANGGPVTYVPTNQTIFDGQRVHGGWYIADRDMNRLLKRAGLVAPRNTGAGVSGAPRHRSRATQSTAWSTWGWIAALGSLAALGAVGAFLIRRKTSLVAAR